QARHDLTSRLAVGKRSRHLAVTPDRDGIGGVDHELAAQKVGHLWYHDPHHVEPERDHHIVRALDRVTIVLRCRALDPPGRRFRLGGYEDAGSTRVSRLPGDAEAESATSLVAL